MRSHERVQGGAAAEPSQVGLLPVAQGQLRESTPREVTQAAPVRVPCVPDVFC